MITKEKSIEMYENHLGLKKYINAIETIQLWESEKIIIEKYIKYNSKNIRFRLWSRKNNLFFI